MQQNWSNGVYSSHQHMDTDKVYIVKSLVVVYLNQHKNGKENEK